MGAGLVREAGPGFLLEAGPGPETFFLAEEAEAGPGPRELFFTGTGD